MWGCAASQSTPPSPSRSTTVGGLEYSWALIEVMREALQHMENVEEGRKDFRKPLILMIDSLARLLFIISSQTWQADLAYMLVSLLSASYVGSKQAHKEPRRSCDRLSRRGETV